MYIINFMELAGINSHNTHTHTHARTHAQTNKCVILFCPSVFLFVRTSVLALSLTLDQGTRYILFKIDMQGWQPSDLDLELDRLIPGDIKH